MALPTIIMGLDEARKHLDGLIHDLRSGKMADPDDMRVSLDHVLDHLCYVWNTRYLSEEEILTHSQADFEKHCNTVPNLMGTRMLE